MLTASSDEGARSFDEASELVIERVDASTLFLPTLKAWRAIERAIERHQPELVLIDPAWPLGLLGPRLSRPYGVVVHGAEVTVPSRLPLVASSLRYVLRRAAVAICAGGYPEAQVRRCAAEYLCPVIQVPPGVDSARFAPLDPAERLSVRGQMGFDAQDFLVASYSRLVPRKGFDTLIRASARLAGRHGELRVVIGGVGRDRARLERLAATLRAPITFLGRVDDESLPRWLAASDLMVMDCRSRWFGLEEEGFGIVFLEAGACAVPAIAGRSGGSADAVLDGVTGAVLARSDSVDDLVEVIERLIDDDEERARLSENARANVVANNTWDRLAKDLSDQLAPFDRFSRNETLA